MVVAVGVAEFCMKRITAEPCTLAMLAAVAGNFLLRSLKSVKMSKRFRLMMSNHSNVEKMVLRVQFIVTNAAAAEPSRDP